jgi:hypothetical protein
LEQIFQGLTCIHFTACFIFIICIIIDDFMSYWSWLFSVRITLFHCLFYFYYFYKIKQAVEQCNSDRKQPRPITHKIINNNKNNKNKTGSGTM